MPLIDSIEAFFHSQLASWPVVGERYDALSRCSTRRVSFPGGSSATLQHNPSRRGSSASRPDSSVPAGAGCCLCRAGQPIEQKELQWREWRVQVNPYPVFSRHFTVSNIEHYPQELNGARIKRMVELAGELPGYAVFFNGSRCGASAPQHLHFQACPSRELPLCNLLLDTPVSPIESGGTLTWGVCHTLGAQFFAIAGTGPWEVAGCCESVLAATVVAGLEPQCNVVAWHESDGRTCMTVHVRTGHRPANYGEADGQRLISPAAAEMAGMWPLARKEDFETITAQELLDIMAEVNATSQQIFEIVQRLC